MPKEERFPDGKSVVKLISGPGFKVAVTGLRAFRDPDGNLVAEDAHGNRSAIRWHPETGLEIDPAMEGFSSELVPEDG